MKRPHKLHRIYKEELDSCKFDMNGKEHPMYEETGFHITEFDTYLQNRILNDIRDKVPDYNDADLRLNSYKLYSKPYSLWTSSC